MMVGKKIFMTAFLIWGAGGLMESMALSEKMGSLPSHEKITYKIKQLGFKAGTATLEFHGLVSLNQQKVYALTFRTEALRFFDEEKIFFDLETFFPIRVERHLNLWGKKESIIENYTPGKVSISKFAKGKKTEQVIDKKHRLDNIYCFIYRYRAKGGFVIGDTWPVHLPTREVTMQVIKKTQIKINGHLREAYYLESDPQGYRVWLSAGPDHVPLRIDGAVGFNKTSLILSDYEKIS